MENEIDLETLVAKIVEKCSRTWWTRLLTTIGVIIGSILIVSVLIYFWKFSLPFIAIVISVGAVYENMWD